MQPKTVSAAPGQLECELHENRPLRLVNAGGSRITCISGIVWVTAYEQPHDIFLKPGQTYDIPNHGLALVEGIKTGWVRLDVPRPQNEFSRRLSGVGKIVRFLKKLPSGFAHHAT